MASLNGLPAEDTVPPRVPMLTFPRQASATVFDHVMMNWNSHGHAPVALFGKPHFDIHFYMVGMAAVAEISPGRPGFAAQAAHLLTKQAAHKDLKQPQAYQRSGYFPTNHSVHYDDQAKEYSISLGGMIMRHAS
ncbi:MAG TPA: DUF5602 domain-containing protein [Pseudonocardiaceae bacterium]|nr:DUF5602 domain-containing protein [Pseudonocardiaceae bacterium]